MNWPNWILKNLFRNRVRTLLTLASVAASLFLVALLAAGYRFLNAPTNSDQSELLLIVSPRASMTMPMPMWYKDRIAAMPGVTAVSPFGYFAGRYRGDDAFVAALAFDPAAVFRFFPDWKVPQDEKSAFIAGKSSLLVGRDLARKYGWRVGEHIHLISPLYSNLSLEFVIRGIFDSASGSSTAVFHWDYLNDALGGSSQTPQFWVRARSADDVPRLTRAIDAEFQRAPVETRTGTLRQAILNFLSLLGNVKLMLLGVSATVIFAVLLVVANTMGMSIRERTPEIATLRAMGFRRNQILGLLAAESVSLSLAGAAFGSLAAFGFARIVSGFAIGGAMPARIAVDGATLGVIAAVAVVIGLASSLMPAYRASRITIAEALRFVG